MEPGTSEWTTVMNRLERLEKQNRRFRQIGAVALVLIGSVLLMGQASPKRTVEANEFLLKDSGGRVRAKLSTEGNLPGPSLVLIDAEGKERVRIGLTETGTKGVVDSSLIFFDDRGNPKIILSNSPDPKLYLWGIMVGRREAFSLTDRHSIQV